MYIFNVLSECKCLFPYTGKFYKQKKGHTLPLKSDNIFVNNL